MDRTEGCIRKKNKQKRQPTPVTLVLLRMNMRRGRKVFRSLPCVFLFVHQTLHGRTTCSCSVLCSDDLLYKKPIMPCLCRALLPLTSPTLTSTVVMIMLHDHCSSIIATVVVGKSGITGILATFLG